MGQSLLRRRVMGGGGGLLPSGYTQIDLHVYTTKQYVDTNLRIVQGLTYRFETKVKWDTVSSSLRQLMGSDYLPFWGCDKGKWAHTLSPESGTNVLEDVWYDVVAESTSNRAEQACLIFNCNNGGSSAVKPVDSYSCYCTIKDYYKIYTNNVLTACFIPCTNPNNEEGMYDIISGVFSPLIQG